MILTPYEQAQIKQIRENVERQKAWRETKWDDAPFLLGLIDKLMVERDWVGGKPLSKISK